jgi:hypothetical protein
MYYNLVCFRWLCTSFQVIKVVIYISRCSFLVFRENKPQLWHCFCVEYRFILQKLALRTISSNVLILSDGIVWVFPPSHRCNSEPCRLVTIVTTVQAERHENWDLFPGGFAGFSVLICLQVSSVASGDPLCEVKMFWAWSYPINCIQRRVLRNVEATSAFPSLFN